MLNYRNDGCGLHLNVVRVPTPMSPKEKAKCRSDCNWKKQIYSLGRDFCMPKTKVEEFINEAERTPAAYNGIYYERAHRKMMKYLEGK